ncbi:MAG: hypothetical protein EXS08_00095 [Planctomycetes bacterium]|nr:hypothetical protein [Planctomycetota bacterium]
MKLLLPPLALFLFSASVRDEVALAYAPAEGTVLRRVFEAKAEYHLTGMSASVNGEEIESDGELPEDSSSFLEHIAVSDTLGATEDGRPAELVRTFDELSQEDTNGAEESANALVSSLQGRKVRFAWDAEAAAFKAEAADGQDLDESQAEDLAEDMDLRLVLPAKAVEVGDEWELDARLYLAFMWPSGLLDFHAEGDEPGDDEFARETIENLAGSGSARLSELREEDGVRVAVIQVELEITTSSDSVLAELEQDGELVHPELTIEVAISRKLSGTILWDLEHGHALSAELECEAERKQTRSWTLTGEHDGEELSAEVEEALLYEGTIHYSATVERQ